MATGSFSLFEWLRLSARSRGPGVPPSLAASQRSLVLVGRARLTSQLAERALRPVEPLTHGSGDAVACELYRQAVQWALSAHAALREEDAVSAPEDNAVSAPEENAAEAASRRESGLSSLWDRADPELLTRAAGGQAALVRLRSELVDKTFLGFAELEPKRQTELAECLRAFTEALIEPFDPAQRQLEKLWVRRIVRILSAAVGVFLLALVLHEVRLWQEGRHDLTQGASWAASSTFWVGGCKAPQQRCPESQNYFFHTLSEQDPWIVFDLGSKRTLSGIFVENRLDCCTERAVPLVVEVSSDNQTWKEVARRDSEFRTWRKRFTRVPARWVKLHVPQEVPLHLAGVRLIP